MEKEQTDRRCFGRAGKEITVYPATVPDSPMVYLNASGEEGEQAYQLLRGSGCRDFTLAVVTNLTWEHDLTPWEMPPLVKNGTPCTGGADAYLRLLTEEIMPGAEELAPGRVLWRGLAGYSLAGLFALYAACRTELFAGIGSISGSLWFPGFKEYVLSCGLNHPPKRIYLSLGDRECRTRNPYLRTVQTATGEIHASLAERGIDTVYQLNPGGHFQNAAQRTAAGIAWLLRAE